MILALGHISGAHINPAVTAGVLEHGALPGTGGAVVRGRAAPGRRRREPGHPRADRRTTADSGRRCRPGPLGHVAGPRGPAHLLSRMFVVMAVATDATRQRPTGRPGRRRRHRRSAGGAVRRSHLGRVDEPGPLVRHPPWSAATSRPTGSTGWGRSRARCSPGGSTTGSVANRRSSGVRSTAAADRRQWASRLPPACDAWGESPRPCRVEQVVGTHVTRPCRPNDPTPGSPCTSSTAYATRSTKRATLSPGAACSSPSS